MSTSDLKWMIFSLSFKTSLCWRCDTFCVKRLSMNKKLVSGFLSLLFQLRSKWNYHGIVANLNINCCFQILISKLVKVNICVFIKLSSLYKSLIKLFRSLSYRQLKQELALQVNFSSSETIQPSLKSLKQPYHTLYSLFK